MDNHIGSSKEIRDLALNSYIQIKEDGGVWHLDRTI
jgi:hypothetical protein